MAGNGWVGDRIGVATAATEEQVDLSVYATNSSHKRPGFRVLADEARISACIRMDYGERITAQNVR